MYQRRESSFALAIAVALALCASGAWAAAPPHAMAESSLGTVSVPPASLLPNGASVATAALGGGDASLAISHTWANIATLCTAAASAVAPPPSTKTELCLDDRSVPQRDLLDILPPVSASAPEGDSTWFATSPTWIGAVASSAPAASTEASSRGIPDLRPDNSPVPPPYWLNIWAPVSASTPGGSGTWSLTSATWTDIYHDGLTPMVSQPGFAVFAGVPGTVTVDDSAGTIGITGMHFTVDGYTLTGDALQLAGSVGSLDNVDVGDGTSASAVDKVVINNALTGSAGLNKVDFGTLTLTGTNTYTGETDINGGTLALAGNGSIADSSGVVIYGNGTFDISGTTNGVAINNLENDGSTDGAVVLGGKTLTINNAYGDGFTGTISGTGGLMVSGGWLTLWRAAYAGLTTIDVGAGLQIGFSGTGASITGDIVDNGSLEFFHNDDVTYGGLISGAGDLIQEGTGKLTLTGNNTFSGGVSVVGATLNGTVLNSTLAISSDANLGASSGAVNLADSTLESTASFTLTHPVVINSVGAPGVYGTIQTDAGTTLTVSAPISGYGTLTKAGDGTLVLTGNNTYGGTTISAGTLQVGDGGTSGSIPSGVWDNSALVFDQSGTVTYGGSIAGTGSVTQGGTGTLVLTGTNGYFGGTDINSGVLQISSDANLGSATSGVVIGNGTLQIDTNGQSFTLTHGITGTDPNQGTLVKQGAGTLTLTAPAIGSQYKFTEIEAGTLALSGGAAALGGPFLGVESGALFDVSQSSNASVSISALNGDGTVALGHESLRIEDGNALWNFGGVIADGGIAGTSGGMLVIFEPNVTGTLSGVNTYTGDTDIEHGTLALAGSGSLAHSSLIDIRGDDATFDISGTTNGATIKRLQGYGGALVLGAKTLTVSDAQVGDVVYTPISGTGRLALTGGTLTLGGANSYTGGTTIDTGATLIVGTGGTGGAIAGDVADNGSLVFGTGGPDLTYGGTISGSGSVAVDSTGTVALTGINTFSGGVTIGGTLSVARDSNLGAAGGNLVLSYGTLETTGSFSTSRNVVLQNFGNIQTDSGSDFSISGDISGSGELTKEGAGTLTVTGTNKYTGGTGVTSGTLRATTMLPGDATVGFGGTLDAVPSIQNDLSNTGTVAVHGGDTTVGGNYSNTGTLAVSLGSKLAVNGTATLSGGTLEVTGADSGYVANTHTDVLTATGGVTGTFGQLVKDPGVVFTSTTIGYGPNDVYLDTTGLNITVAAKAMGIVEPAAMSAAQRVQDGFEAINATMASGGTPSSNVLQGAGAIQHSATPAVAQATLTSLSGQLHAASAAMLFGGIDARSNALSEHFDDLAGGRTTSGVWYSDLGWQGNLQRSGYAGATFRSNGGMAGADMRIGSHALVGFAIGQSLGFGQLDAAWDHSRTSMNNIAMYGGVMNGPWYASAQIANGWYREDMQRLLQLGALGSPVGGNSTGGYVGGALEGGRLFNLGTTRIVPFADVRYQRLDLGGFNEQGGLGYGLTADARAAGRLQAGLGLRAERGWRLVNGMRMEFDGSAGWQHTLHQYGSVFDASFTGFNDWLPVEGVGLSRNMVVLRAGLSLWPSRGFGLRLGYMREQGERERAGSAMLQGTVMF